MIEHLSWPPWIQTVAGLLGISLALAGVARAQTHGWRDRADRTSTVSLLIVSVALCLTGLVRWLL